MTMAMAASSRKAQDKDADGDREVDVEKGQEVPPDSGLGAGETESRYLVESGTLSSHALTRKLLSWGIETRGIHPVPLPLRTDTQYFKIFFLWFSMNFNILSFSAGTLGPVAFGLGIRESCLVILFFNMLSCIPPAYFATWGPNLGLRQMVQARYSFGYYGVILPCVLNLVNMFGFCLLNCILGGQTLASVANGNLSWTIGIVIITVISLALSFCGFKVLNWYERIAWFPVLVVFLVALGVGGKHLSEVPPSEPATAPAILSFAASIAGFTITYSSLASDFTSYYRPDGASVRVFMYTYLGLLLPIASLQCLGAAVSAAASVVPIWSQGYDNSNVGGLLEAMLSPTGNFGKFLTVLLSLSVTGNIAATFYSISLNIQVFIPALVVVPRYVFSVVATAIVLPLAIVGSHKFYTTLSNFLSLIGYWSSAFIAIVLLEHTFFRQSDFSSYDLTIWNVPRKLPSGVPAIAAGIASFGLVVPCMDQVWFVGPIGEKTGDVGFEVAFVVSAVLYVGFRALEIKIRGVAYN